MDYKQNDIYEAFQTFVTQLSVRKFEEQNNLPFNYNYETMSDDIRDKIYSSRKKIQDEQLTLSLLNDKSLYNNPDFYENGKFIENQHLNIVLPSHFKSKTPPHSPTDPFN